MKVSKHNGDRYFDTTPETQTELELALSRLDLVSSIGRSIRNHRAELERLERQIRGAEQEPVRPPGGYLFVVETLRGIKPRFQISRYVPGRDGYWKDTRTEEYERGTTFLAGAIAAESTYNHDDAGSVYAYGPDDDPQKRVRCRLDPRDYKVRLVAVDSLPDLLVNPMPEPVLVEQV